MTQHEQAQTDDINETRVTLTVPELAQLLGIGRVSAYRLARRIGFRVGKHLRITRAEVAALMAEPAQREVKP